MFVGHAAVAFALAAAVAARRGWESDRALAVGLLAGAFAAVPDIDIAYALVGVAGAVGAGPAPGVLDVATTFWATGNVVHRAVTHSLVLAPLAALVAALAVDDARTRALAVVPAVVLVAAPAVVSGGLGALVGTLFALGTVAVAELARRRTGFGPAVVFSAAMVGFVSHPFGDLLTGHPPAMLYPLDATVVTERVALAGDPTLHLLGAFGVELATVWLAIAVAGRVVGVRPTAAISRRAAVGVGYAASVVLIPAPTLDLSYPFVFSVLGVGLVGVVPRVGRSAVTRRPAVRAPDWTVAATTGLAAVTIGWLAYAVAYVAL
jgi:membrane-bound metal-dependent hydrolase YbcI (DUF457 family)